MEGEGTSPRTGHCRENLSRGKKNEESEANGKMWEC